MKNHRANEGLALLARNDCLAVVEKNTRRKQPTDGIHSNILALKPSAGISSDEHQSAKLAMAQGDVRIGWRIWIERIEVGNLKTWGPLAGR